MNIQEAMAFFETQWKVETTLPNGDQISTVEVPPIGGSPGGYFQTMVFSKDGSSRILKNHENKREAISFHMWRVIETERSDAS